MPVTIGIAITAIAIFTASVIAGAVLRHPAVIGTLHHHAAIGADRLHASVKNGVTDAVMIGEMAAEMIAVTTDAMAAATTDVARTMVAGKSATATGIRTIASAHNAVTIIADGTTTVNATKTVSSSTIARAMTPVRSSTTRDAVAVLTRSRTVILEETSSAHLTRVVADQAIRPASHSKIRKPGEMSRRVFHFNAPIFIQHNV